MYAAMLLGIGCRPIGSNDDKAYYPDSSLMHVKTEAMSRTVPGGFLPTALLQKP